MGNILRENEINSIREFVHIMKKHIFLLSTIILIIFIISILLAILSSPKFTATVTFEIDPIRKLTAWKGQDYAIGNIVTEMEILHNQETLLATLSSMDLSKYSQINKDSFQEIFTNPTKLKEIERLIKSTVLSNTNIITVSMEHSDAGFVQDFLAKFIPEYEEAILGYANSQLKREREFLMLNQKRAEENLLVSRKNLEELLVKENVDNNDDILPLLYTQLQNETSNNVLTILAALNPKLLEIIEQIRRDTEIVVDYRDQINLLDAFLSQEKKVIRVIDGIQLIDEDGSSDMRMILLLGFLFGVLFAPLIVLFYEYNTCYILCKIPHLNDFDIRKREKVQYSNLPSKTLIDQLKGYLLYSMDRKVFTISSLGEGEKSSKIISEIALSVYESGKRVLIISTRKDEANLFTYKQVLKEKKLFDIIKFMKIDIKNQFGTFDSTKQIHILELDYSENMYAQVLHTREFSESIKLSTENYDLVLIDGPIFAQASDFMVVAKITDGIILNIRAHLWTRRQLRAFITTLDLCNIPLLGVIIYDTEKRISFWKRKRII